MKKRISIAFIVVLALALLACALVACDPKTEEPPKAETVTVSFNFGGLGKNSTATGKPGEALELPQAADTDSYYFGGWFASSSFAGEALVDPVFPSKNAVYYAKWFVKFKFEVSVEGFDGEFSRDERFDYQGESAKGATDRALASAENFNIPEGYALEEASYSLPLVARDNTMAVRFKRAALNVTYVSGMRGVADKTERGVYGMFAGGNLFDGVEGRRVIGWARTATGAPEIFEGDRILAAGNQRLYAVWAEEYTDALGGADLIYVADEGSDIALLVKRGIGEMRGTFDRASRTFAFADGEETRLEGKVLEHEFLYFKDLYLRTFNSDIENDRDTLEFKERGGAVYTDKQGKLHEGSYTIDERSGDFRFESPDFSNNFRLYEERFTGVVTFRMKDELEGFYAHRGEDGFDYIVLHLDGYGGAYEVWDPQHPYYDPYDEYEEVYFEGEYEIVGESAGMPEVEVGIMRVPSVFLDEWYTVRLDTSKTGSFGGVQISGECMEKDAYQGEYMSATDDEDETLKLTLDGYEFANYMGQSGTYETERIRWYEFNGEYDDEDNQIYEMHSHSYILFHGDDGSEAILTLDINDYNVVNLYYVISEEQNVFTFENPTSFLYDVKTELMLELWHEQAIVWESHAAKNRVTYYTRLDEGATTKLDDGWTRFEGEKTFDFKIESLTEYVVRWRGAANALTLREGELYIDEFGVGKYRKGESEITVDYEVDEGFVDVYHFSVEGKRLSFAVSDGGDVKEITDLKPLDEDRATSSLYARMILTDDGTRAMLGFRLSGGAYAYLAEGTIAANGDEFGFEAEAWDSEYEFELDGYLSFTFKRGDGTFVKNDGYNIVAQGDGYTFVADGYGNATLAEDGKDPVAGSYEFLEGLTAFVFDGGETLLKIGQTGNVRSLKIVGDEAGYYYELKEGSVSSESSYFFLDGDGGVIFAQYDATYGFLMGTGTYTKRNDVDGDGYRLYTLELSDEGNSIEGTFVAHVGSEDTTDGRKIGVFWIENPVKSGTYITRINGEEIGYITVEKGVAVWITDGILLGDLTRCDVLDKEIETMFQDGFRGVRENANGKSLLFTHGVQGEEGYLEFVFDITDETRSVDGVDYPIADARMMDYGMYALFDGELKNERIYLDGHGNMTTYDAAGGIADTGTVTPKIEDGNVYTFKGEKSGFDFVIALRQGTLSSEMSRFEYVVYDENSDRTYVGDDLSALVLDGFGGGTLYDKYGMAVSGTYKFVVGNIIEFEYNIVDVAYIALKNGRFEVDNDEFVSIGGVLYYYRGSDREITIPQEITTIASGALSGSYITKINFANVTTIEDDALAGLPLTEIVSDKITYVGDGAFADMGDYLKTVSLPHATHIGAGAFFGDTAIENVRFDDATYIGSMAFTLRDSNGTLLLDLRNAKNVVALRAEDDAFVSLGAEEEPTDEPVRNLRALVKDIATVNALLANADFPAMISQNAVICYSNEATALRASQTQFAKVFFSASTGDVYILDGMLSKIVDIDNGEKESVGIYEYSTSVEQDRVVENLKIYPYADGSYALTPITLENNVLKINGDTLIEIGAQGKPKTYELTDSYTEKVITLSMSVGYDVIAGLSFEVSALFDGEDTTSANVRGGRITFVHDQTQYSVQIVSATSCVLYTAGGVKTVTTALGKYRVGITVGVDQKIEACVSFEEKDSQGQYQTRTLNSASPNEDGTISVNVDPIGFGLAETFVVRYNADSDTVTIMEVGSTRQNFDGYDYEIRLMWDVETYQAEACLGFWIDDVGYDVLEFLATANNVARITIDMNGERIAFEVMYTTEFGYRLRSVRQV